MAKIIRAYIATFRPSRNDGVPREIYKPLRPKYAYGVRVLVDDRSSNIASSWVKSKEPMLPEITALANLLTALEGYDEISKIDLFTSSAHLDTRMRQVENRRRKKDRGETVGELKEEALWEDTTLRFQLMKHGMREGIREHEVQELKLIRDALRNEFYSSDRFSSAEAPEFQLIFSDV